MSDRELLEYAAKAAGYVLGKHTQKDWACTYGGKEWNPLTDDRDAFRLTVKLGLFISHSAYKPGENAYGFVRISWYGQRVEFESEKFTDDPYAATRRAIVRAAAEIGRRS